MAGEKHEAIVEIALEVHNLLTCPGVRDRYVENIWQWIEEGREQDRQRAEHNSALVAQFLEGEDPEQAPKTAALAGPAPLRERPPERARGLTVRQCYVLTATIHDALVGDLLAETSHAVETICPAEVKYRRFRLLTVKDEAGRFFNEAELRVRPLRE